MTQTLTDQRTPGSRRAPAADPSNAIVARDLRKAYAGSAALDGADLTVPCGSVFALLGPNGSGKTTTVRILSTLIAADSGSAVVMGHDVNDEPDAVRAAIAVTGQFSAVDNLLTGEQNLLLMARLFRLGGAEGRRRAAELLERFDLTDASKRPPATYSGGMRRRLDIAMTLVGDPQLIFLDEPTTGLDPRGRHVMWDTIRDLVAKGVTIFLTTQYLEEADQLADRIAVLDHGVIVAEGAPAELKRQVPGSHVELRFAHLGDLDRVARAFGDVDRDDGSLTLRVPCDSSVPALRAVLDRIGDDIEVAEFAIHTPDLNDVFFALTGEGIDKEDDHGNAQ